MANSNEGSYSIKEIIKANHAIDQEDHKAIMKSLNSMNGRVRKLENWRSFLLGLGIALPFLANLILRRLAP